MAAPAGYDQFPAEINVPTLVVAGDHDAISPPTEMESIAAAIPDAEFVVIPNCGPHDDDGKPHLSQSSLAELHPITRLISDRLAA